MFEVNGACRLTEVLQRMLKILYAMFTSALFGAFGACLYLVHLAFDRSGLPANYRFLFVVPVVLGWAILQNKLKDAYKSVRR